MMEVDLDCPGKFVEKGGVGWGVLLMGVPLGGVVDFSSYGLL
jgi:hypothetical protein